MSGGITSGRSSRRAFLKALGAAGGMVILSSGALGCVSSSMNDTPTLKPTGNLTYTVTGQVTTKFADYAPMPVSVTPSLKDYVIGDIAALDNLDSMGIDDAGKRALMANLFYLRPSTDDQVYDVYKNLKEAGLPAFVTTDSVLHAYHILFDYILRTLEMQHFSPDIIDLSRLMFDESTYSNERELGRCPDCRAQERGIFCSGANTAGRHSRCAGIGQRHGAARAFIN